MLVFFHASPSAHIDTPNLHKHCPSTSRVHRDSLCSFEPPESAPYKLQLGGGCDHPRYPRLPMDTTSLLVDHRRQRPRPPRARPAAALPPRAATWAHPARPGLPPRHSATARRSPLTPLRGSGSVLEDTLSAGALSSRSFSGPCTVILIATMRTALALWQLKYVALAVALS